MSNYASETNAIIVTAPANPPLSWGSMLDGALSSPPQVALMLPAYGIVAGHVIEVRFKPGRPPLKPEAAEAVMAELASAFERVGQAVAAVADNAVFQFGPRTITGADLKGAYFALTTIEVADDIYMTGYAGENYGTRLEINQTFAMQYGTQHGDAGFDYLMLHEAAHNSVLGRAIVQKNWDDHTRSGGTAATYTSSSPYLQKQEAMTNTLSKQMAQRLGIAINFTPTYGYYSGTEWNQY